MNIRQMASSELKKPLYPHYDLKGRHNAIRRHCLPNIDVTNALF